MAGSCMDCILHLMSALANIIQSEWCAHGFTLCKGPVSLNALGFVAWSDGSMGEITPKRTKERPNRHPCHDCPRDCYDAHLCTPTIEGYNFV